MNASDAYLDLAGTTAPMFFPARLDGPASLILERVSRTTFYREAGPLLRELFPMNLDVSSPGSSDPTSEARASARRLSRDHFWRLHAEHFLAKRNDEVVGWAAGEMMDEETFYCRNGAVIPELQGQGVMNWMFKQIISFLCALGYSRLVLRHLTTNREMAIFILKQGFYISGLTTDERWGSNIETTLVTESVRRSLLEREFGAVPGSHSEPVLNLVGDNLVIWPPVPIDDLLRHGVLHDPIGAGLRGRSRHVIAYVRPHDRDALIALLRASFLPVGYMRRVSDRCWVELCRDVHD